jgi:hypothetical protein
MYDKDDKICEITSGSPYVGMGWVETSCLCCTNAIAILPLPASYFLSASYLVLTNGIVEQDLGSKE